MARNKKPKNRRSPLDSHQLFSLGAPWIVSCKPHRALPEQVLSVAKRHRHRRTEQPSVSAGWGPCRISRPFYRSLQGSDQITGPSARVGLDSYQTIKPSAQAVSYCPDLFRQQVAVTVAGACSSVVTTAVAGVEACVRLKLGRRRDLMFASSFAASTES